MISELSIGLGLAMLILMPCPVAPLLQTAADSVKKGTPGRRISTLRRSRTPCTVEVG